MKKFKFLSMALAAIIFASCSSDDLEVAGNYELADDGTEVFVTINDDVDGTMRAGFATQTTNVTNIKFSQQAYFMKGDQFKMYCTDTWKPQVYEFTKNVEINGVNGALFTWAEDYEGYKRDGNATDLTNREYGVFPADAFEFTDEFRKTLDFKLKSQNYGEYKGETGAIDGEARPVYKAEIPMFGKLIEDNKIQFNYMTALIRVQMYGMQANKEYVMTLTTTADAETSYKLSGTFKSTEFDGVKGSETDLPVFSVAETEIDEEKSLTLTFTPTESDGVVYLPLPVGEYNLGDLKLSYTVGEEEEKEIDLRTLDTNEDGTRKLCSEYEAPVTLKAGLRLVAVEEKNETAEISTLEELNNLLAGTEDVKGWADFGRDVTVNVTLKSDIEVLLGESKDDNYEYVGGDKKTKLIIPQLKNNVKLIFEEGEHTIKSSEGATLLPVVDADDVTDGTYKLTLSGISTELPVGVKTIQGLGLEGELSKTLTVTKAGALDLDGTFAEAVTVVEAGDVNLAGVFSEGVTVGTEEQPVGNVIFTGNTVKTLTVYATNFVGKGTFASAANNPYSNNITATGEISLEKSATSSIFKTYGTAKVTIAENIQIYTLQANGTGDVDVDGKVNNLTLNNTATVNVKGSVLTKLAVGEATEGAKVVVSENGSIKLLDNSKDAGVTVTTYDAAMITTVTDANDAENPTEITAYWTEKTTEALTKADINNGNIYTALQLAALQTTNVTTINLYANVVANDVEWTSSKAFANGGTFNGNGHSITGLNIVSGSGNNAGFFKSIASGEATVENLTLENITVDGKRNGNSLTDGIGGLVGRLAGKLTVKTVSLSGKVEADNSMNIGGLVGTNVGTLEIEESEVALTAISGKARMGGLVGVVGANASVNVKKSEVSISDIKLEGTPNTDVKTKDAQLATIGMYVGMLQQATSALTVDEDTKITEGSYNIKDYLTELGFDDVTTVRFGQSIFRYVGQKDGNFVGFSPLYTAGKAKIGNKTYTTNEEADDCLNYYQYLKQVEE